MLISVIIIAISFCLDGILTNFLPYGVGDLSLFTPLTTLVSIVVVYSLFHDSHSDKKYLITSFVVGFLYDLCYTNLLFFNAILFLLIAYLNKVFDKQFGHSYIKIIIKMFLIIVIYELTTVLCIIILNLVPINIDRILYKISHSLILNLIYAEILYIIVKLIPRKYRKIKLY